MPTEFLTPSAPARAELVVQRSRFLSRIEPASTEAAARAVIAEVRGEHPQARHHCSAFIVGDDEGDDDARDAIPIQRSSDDGEPSGTAGRPILDALVGAELGHVVCVVTRYFGGVLLGTGGLVRAYREAAQAAIDASSLVRVQQRSLITVQASHHEVSALQHLARVRGWQIVDTIWAQDVTFAFAVLESETANALAEIVRVSAGRAHGTVVGVRLMPDS